MMLKTDRPSCCSSTEDTRPGSAICRGAPWLSGTSPRRQTTTFCRSGNRRGTFARPRIRMLAPWSSSRVYAYDNVPLITQSDALAGQWTRYPHPIAVSRGQFSYAQVYSTCSLVHPHGSVPVMSTGLIGYVLEKQCRAFERPFLLRDNVQQLLLEQGRNQFSKRRDLFVDGASSGSTFGREGLAGHAP